MIVWLLFCHRSLIGNRFDGRGLLSNKRQQTNAVFIGTPTVLTRHELGIDEISSDGFFLINFRITTAHDLYICLLRA